MKVRHIIDRVTLQRVHFSFLRILTCLKCTAAIYNGKIVDTGVKVLPLIYMYVNYNSIFDYNNIGLLNTHTFV
jgi:hypothetical protein